jgi:HEAT repeat protein
MKRIALLALLASASASAAGPTESDLNALAIALSTGNRPAVDQAIERLRFYGQPREVLSRIARAATEGNLLARRNATYVFSIVADPTYAPALVPALKDDDPAVREKACTALGKMKTRSVAGALLPLVRDPAPSVRREALRALGALGAREAVPASLEALADPEAEPRIAATLALGDLGDARAALKLVPMLKDRSETTSFAAAKSLCKLNRPEGRAFAESLLESKDAGARKDGVRLVGDVRQPWVKQRLLGLLGDPETGVAVTAARALSAQGDGRGVEWLVLRSETADPELKVRIEGALEDLGLTPADRRKILAAKRK